MIEPSRHPTANGSRRCWMHPTSENREAIRKGLNAEGVRGEYSVGIPNFQTVAAKRTSSICSSERYGTETALRVSGDQNLGMRVDIALGSGGRCGEPNIPIMQAAGEMRLGTVRIPSGVGIRWFLRCPLGSTCRVPKTEERRGTTNLPRVVQPHQRTGNQRQLGDGAKPLGSS
jgi:hypothetical protein